MSAAIPAREENNAFARFGSRLADWVERWFPDAFIFALVAVVIVFLGGLLARSTPEQMVKYFGDGFWSIIPFTMQMAMLIVGGYVVATSPPVKRVIDLICSRHYSSRGAVAWVAFFSMATSLLSYGFSLVFSGLLVRELLRRNPHVDYRAAGAAGYLGLGSIWALGLSSSAALMMSAKASVPPALLKISGVIPLAATIFTWQSALVIVILLAVSLWVAWASAPTGASVRPMPARPEDAAVPAAPAAGERKPGEWLEHSPLLTILICAIGFWYLGQVARDKGVMAAVDLNTYNLAFLLLGMLLHWRPRAILRAGWGAVPSTAGVLVQFPFYGGILGMMTGSALTKILADFFVSISTRDTLSVVVGVYSAILGLFIPSAGGKWLVEAPYVLAAANDHQVHLGWIVQVYNIAEALPNLVNPFWMLPILGVLRVRARELMGYSVLQLLIHTPIVLILCYVLAKTFTYAPPVIPP